MAWHGCEADCNSILCLDEEKIAFNPMRTSFGVLEKVRNYSTIFQSSAASEKKIKITFGYLITLNPDNKNLIKAIMKTIFRVVRENFR
jgi:hypothetical protein